MSETAPKPGLEPPSDDELEFSTPRPGSRLGLALAAVIALAASAGLAWWFAAPNHAADVSAPTPAAAAPPTPKVEAPAPLRFAAPDPNPAEVRRAWTDVRQGYAEAGGDALVRASQACAGAVPTDPQRLDYCLAYDIYAASIAPPAATAKSDSGQGDWFAAAGERGLALARTALPQGVSPENRVAQVTALTKAVLPKATPIKPKAHAANAARRKAALVKARKGRTRLHAARHHAHPRRVAPPPPPQPRDDPFDPPH